MPQGLGVQLGLGGGRSAPASGAPAGGGAFVNEKSLDFDGTDDYVNINSVASEIAASDDFSFSAWVKTNGGSGYVMRCSEAADSTSYKETIGIGIFSDHTYGLMQNVSTAVEYWDTSGAEVNDDAWHHLALTISDSSGTSTLKVYVDGSLAGTHSASVTIPNTISVASIARRPYNSSGNGDLYLAGLIDEVALWDSTLSASDISDIYNSGTPADLDSLNPTGWWRMGDEATWGGSNWTLPDASGNGNGATTANMQEGDRVEDVP